MNIKSKCRITAIIALLCACGTAGGCDLELFGDELGLLPEALAYGRSHPGKTFSDSSVVPRIEMNADGGIAVLGHSNAGSTDDDSPLGVDGVYCDMLPDCGDNPASSGSGTMPGDVEDCEGVLEDVCLV